jgi:shikimate 5-dehydrogenase
VFGRHLGRARLVAALADGDAFEGVPGRGSWDLLVNATPVGASPDVDRTPVDAERLEGGVVYDLVYDPPVTRLMREARAAGCRTVGGLDMLVAQAQRQNEWWTGARS